MAKIIIRADDSFEAVASQEKLHNAAGRVSSAEMKLKQAQRDLKIAKTMDKIRKAIAKQEGIIAAKKLPAAGIAKAKAEKARLRDELAMHKDDLRSSKHGNLEKAQQSVDAAREALVAAKGKHSEIKGGMVKGGKLKSKAHEENMKHLLSALEHAKDDFRRMGPASPIYAAGKARIAKIKEMIKEVEGGKLYKSLRPIHLVGRPKEAPKAAPAPGGGRETRRRSQFEKRPGTYDPKD